MEWNVTLKIKYFRETSIDIPLIEEVGDPPTRHTLGDYFRDQSDTAVMIFSTNSSFVHYHLLGQARRTIK
jgi:hypothetical protein